MRDCTGTRCHGYSANVKVKMTSFYQPHKSFYNKGVHLMFGHAKYLGQ